MYWLTIRQVAERLNKEEADIEQLLQERELHASIYVADSSLLGPDNYTGEYAEPGWHELSNYIAIKWDENGNYDLQKGHLPKFDVERGQLIPIAGTFLRKLAGDPLQVRDEWEKTGRLRSLRYFWRFNAYGHSVYRPAGPLVINKDNIRIELAEVKAYEEENNLSPDKNIKEENPISKPEIVQQRRQQNPCILEAIRKFLREGKGLVKETDVKIGKKFTKTYTRKKPMKITLSDQSCVNASVFFENGEIRCDGGERYDGQKVKESIIRPICYNTFEKSYIPKIKKEFK